MQVAEELEVDLSRSKAALVVVKVAQIPSVRVSVELGQDFQLELCWYYYRPASLYSETGSRQSMVAAQESDSQSSQ